MSARRFLAKMRLVGKELFEKYGGCTWGLVLGTAPKGVFNRATKHTADKSLGIFALEVGERIDRVYGKPSIRRWLITLHGFLGRRHEGTSVGRWPKNRW
jgi:hypothetical protein